MSDTKLLLSVVGFICLLLFIGLFFGGINVAFIFENIWLITFIIIFIPLLNKNKIKGEKINVKGAIPKAIGLTVLAGVIFMILYMFMVFTYYNTR